MGNYLNPGNSGFRGIRNDIYIDKSGLIGLVNQTIDTPRCLTCISRPRRFGKSFAAQMMCAYYDKTCDSAGLFDDLKIAGDKGYREHLNRYDVVYLDMTEVIGGASVEEVVPYIQRNVIRELTEQYPDMKRAEGFAATMANAAKAAGNKLVMIIDEWDAPIREAQGRPGLQRKYLEFLRSLFKNSGMTSKIFAAVYMTGILPVKKDGSQSAISDFTEYPILNPGAFAEYTGFTEEDVQKLCSKYGMSFEDTKKWYDGYDFSEIGAAYNPYSVMCAVRSREFQSYWRKTSAAESLMTYINMDFEGMQEVVLRLIAGEEIEVDTEGFENDFETFRSRDDVMTLLIHLGYLTWDRKEKVARIPNEEIKAEFRKVLKGENVNRRWLEMIRHSQKLLESTIAGDSGTVVKAIEAIRQAQYAPTFYNNEQALRYVIKFAYIAAIDQYLKVEELPSGKGVADVVYLPKRKSMLPAMIVELKWDKSSEGAIGQIKRRNYPVVLQDYGGEIVMVGIGYNPKTKVHTCEIERI